MRSLQYAQLLPQEVDLCILVNLKSFFGSQEAIAIDQCRSGVVSVSSFYRSNNLATVENSSRRTAAAAGAKTRTPLTVFLFCFVTKAAAAAGVLSALAVV